MKSKSFVTIEVGIDRVQKFDLDDGGGGIKAPARTMMMVGSGEGSCKAMALGSQQ